MSRVHIVNVVWRRFWILLFFASAVSHLVQRVVMSAALTQVPGAAAPASVQVLSLPGCFRNAVCMRSGQSGRWAGRGADSLYISSPNRSGQARSAVLISFSRPPRPAFPSDWLLHGPTACGPCTWPSWRWKGAFSSAPFAPQYPHEAPVCTLYRFSGCFL